MHPNFFPIWGVDSFTFGFLYLVRFLQAINLRHILLSLDSLVVASNLVCCEYIHIYGLLSNLDLYRYFFSSFGGQNHLSFMFRGHKTIVFQPDFPNCFVYKEIDLLNLLRHFNLIYVHGQWMVLSSGSYSVKMLIIDHRKEPRTDPCGTP